MSTSSSRRPSFAVIFAISDTWPMARPPFVPASTVLGDKPSAVTRFLSDAWFDEVERALGSAGEGEPAEAGGGGGDGAPARLTIQQVVTATPDGEVRFHLEIGPERVALRRGQ